MPPLPKAENLAVHFFTVNVPPPTHPESIEIERDDPNRGPIPLACQLDQRVAPLSRGIVIACHGMVDNRDKPLVSYLRDYLPFHTVTFDFRGMGESGGQTEFANHGKEADDIKAVVDHVEREFAKELGPVVAVMGHSKGGVATNIWAARYPEQSIRVGRIINLNTLYFNGAIPKDDADSGEQLPSLSNRPTPYVLHKFRRGPRGKRNEVVDFIVDDHGIWYRNEVLKLDKIAGRIPKSISVLTVMGETDNLTTPKRDKPLWEAAYGKDRDHMVAVLPGCDHYYNEKVQQERCGEAVASWLAERVVGDGRMAVLGAGDETRARL